MLQCLIIDDDKFERDGLRYMISRMELPIEVTDVRNGKLGLECLQKNSFDMVITDIKMPVMDGMTFLEKAKQLRPDLVYIIYSGYSDFLYAKKAISLQVLDFLVKPVSDEEFEKVMHRTLSAIEGNKKRRIYEILEYLRVGKVYPEFLDPGGKLVLLKTGTHFSNEYAVLEEEIPIVAIQDNRYLCYLVEGKRQADIHWDTYEIEGGFVSEVLNSWEDLEKAFERLKAMLEECIFSKEKKVISEREYKNTGEFVCECPEQWFLLVREYLALCGFLNRKMRRSLTKGMPGNAELLSAKLEQAGTVNEVVDMISCYQEQGQDHVVSEVKFYIKKNYYMDLGIDELAKLVYLNPAYLCTIFKRQTGTTLINYLTDFRIEKAIELLKKHELKTSEVARMVGYNNISYFNMVFKNKTGKTPGQFRKEQNH